MRKSSAFKALNDQVLKGNLVWPGSPRDYPRLTGYVSKLRKIRQQNLAAMETWQRRTFIGVISGLAAAIERPKFHLAPIW